MSFLGPRGLHAQFPEEAIVIIISGWIDVADRSAYLAECRTVVAAAREAPGCLEFALSADLLEPARINVYERWESDEELMAFRGAGPDAGQTAQILSASVARYRISAVEPA